MKKILLISLFADLIVSIISALLFLITDGIFHSFYNTFLTLFAEAFLLILIATVLYTFFIKKLRIKNRFSRALISSVLLIVVLHAEILCRALLDLVLYPGILFAENYAIKYAGWTPILIVCAIVIPLTDKMIMRKNHVIAT